jgi:hypothetical protein
MVSAQQVKHSNGLPTSSGSNDVTYHYQIPLCLLYRTQSNYT